MRPPPYVAVPTARLAVRDTETVQCAATRDRRSGSDLVCPSALQPSPASGPAHGGARRPPCEHHSIIREMQRPAHSAAH